MGMGPFPILLPHPQHTCIQWAHHPLSVYSPASNQLAVYLFSKTSTDCCHNQCGSDTSRPTALVFVVIQCLCILCTNLLFCVPGLSPFLLVCLLASNTCMPPCPSLSPAHASHTPPLPFFTPAVAEYPLLAISLSPKSSSTIKKTLLLPHNLSLSCVLVPPLSLIYFTLLTINFTFINTPINTLTSGKHKINLLTWSNQQLTFIYMQDLSDSLGGEASSYNFFHLCELEFWPHRQQNSEGKKIMFPKPLGAVLNLNTAGIIGRLLYIFF